MPDLPNEILLLIFDHLTQIPLPENYLFPSVHVFYDVLKLLRVCRAWYDLFLHKVYYSLEVHSSQKQLYLLARSLRENPRLGTAVRRLWTDSLRDWSDTRSGYWDEDQDEDADDEVLVDDPKTKPFHDLLEKVSVDRKEHRRWQRALLRDSGDAWMAICFLLLPKLQFFKVNYLEGSKTWIPHAISRIATGSIDLQPMPLQHLEEVIISGDQGYACRPCSDFFPYFLLPSMRSFRGHAITGLREGHGENIYKTPQPTPKSSGITELILDLTYGSGGVTQYITACANLRVFQYEHTLKDPNDHYPIWSPSIIYDALTTQRHSLQVLWMSFEKGDPFMDSYRFITDLDEQWFGSLVEFTQLREIYMPLGILLDFRGDWNHPKLSLDETIPRSVENLYLGEVREEDYGIAAKGLSAMLLCRKERFPALQSIELWFVELSPEDKGWLSQLHNAFAAVKRMCLEEGVEFRYSPEFGFIDGWDLEGWDREVFKKYYF